MHLNFRVGPVEHRAPSQEVRVLHLFEGVLNVVLGAVGRYNLFVGPAVVVGEQNGFAELEAAEQVQGLLIGEESQFQAFVNLTEALLHFGFQYLFHELGGADCMDLFFHGFQGRGFASLHLPFPAALEIQLQGTQFPERLVQMSG